MRNLLILSLLVLLTSCHSGEYDTSHWGGNYESPDRPGRHRDAPTWGDRQQVHKQANRDGYFDKERRHKKPDNYNHYADRNDGLQSR